jgi:hypothetical protein
MAWGPPPPPPPPVPLPLPPDACLGCGARLQYIGVEQFRVGGTSGVGRLVMGELGELGEHKIPLELFACPVCRRVEMRIPPNR